MPCFCLLHAPWLCGQPAVLAKIEGKILGKGCCMAPLREAVIQKEIGRLRELCAWFTRSPDEPSNKSEREGEAEHKAEQDIGAVDKPANEAQLWADGVAAIASWDAPSVARA